jgi:NAD(P)-dependent dehydrogenase (short-subunit alcohol dehydrogenase family)
MEVLIIKLQDKVAIVTGAASGIGRAIAMLYAKEGAKVILADLNQEKLNQVENEIVSSGGIAKSVLVNVAKEDDINNMIDTAINTYGTVDILVNNAGVMDNFEPVEVVSNQTWERVFDINVKGAMYAIRKSMPTFLAKNKGVIINVASIGGLEGSRAGVAYTASKHAIIGLTKNVGYQYAKLGIRCNAIAPGAVNTSIGSTITAPNKFGMDISMTGMNINPRVIEPIEMAEIALFLASDSSSAINGTVIVGDTGWTAY